MDRLLAIPEYVQLFQAAYPSVPPGQLGFQHAANAIAAFEADAFTSLGSPLDHYLKGDATALGEAEKRGAVLFFGKANCGACHLGPHLTDNLFHSIGVPQVGPGSVEDAPQDRGRERVTGSPSHSFQFRTPPLRNVELTAENRRMLYVPEGFAHGYQTLVDGTETYYQVSEFYAPGAEGGLRWDDPALAIEWPEADERIVSAKDESWPDFVPVSVAAS